VQVLLKRLYLSLDPAMRGWMRDIPSYIPPVALGAEMRGSTVNEVVASTSPKFAIGDIVQVNILQCRSCSYVVCT
jgi:NADPH-dependent curcumin reductase CurA